MPLRREVIVREKLKFPTGTATAVMIGVLYGKIRDNHKNHQTVHEDEATHELLPDDSRSDYPSPTEESLRTKQEVAIRARSRSGGTIQLLGQSFGLLGLYVSLRQGRQKI